MSLEERGNALRGGFGTVFRQLLCDPGAPAQCVALGGGSVRTHLCLSRRGRKPLLAWARLMFLVRLSSVRRSEAIPSSVRPARCSLKYGCSAMLSAAASFSFMPSGDWRRVGWGMPELSLTCQRQVRQKRLWNH